MTGIKQYHPSSTCSMWAIQPKNIPTTIRPRSRPKKTVKEKKAELDVIKAENSRKNAVAEAAGYANPWTLKCGIIVERPQVITPLPEPWLQKYEEFMEKWNRPLLNQYPPLALLDEDIDTLKQREADEERREKERAKTIATESAEEKVERLDREAREARLKAIREKRQEIVIQKVPSRITEADKQNDTRSVYRKLDCKLFLLVKKIGLIMIGSSHKESYKARNY